MSCFSFFRARFFIFLSSFIASRCVLNMLRVVHEFGVHTYVDARKYFGEMFAVRVNTELPPWCTVDDVTDYILK